MEANRRDVVANHTIHYSDTIIWDKLGNMTQRQAEHGTKRYSPFIQAMPDGSLTPGEYV